MTAPKRVISIANSEKQESSFSTFPTTYYIASGPQLFCIDNDAIFLGGTTNCLLRDYYRYSAVAASQDGSAIAYMRCPVKTPSIQFFRRVGDEWVESHQRYSPMVGSVGYCSLISSRQDMVFVSDDIVAYLGEFVRPVNDSAYEAFVSRTSDFTRWPLDDLDGENQDCFLFLTRVSDGYTTAYCRFKYKSPIERRLGHGAGNMVTNSDGTKLYLRVYGKILVFETRDLARKLNGN